MTRFFDIVFSGMAIVALLPFMLPIMIGLKLTGEHDIFYKQTRIGKGGKPFGVFKFATMLRNSEKMPGGVLTQKNDPRKRAKCTRMAFSGIYWRLGTA